MQLNARPQQAEEFLRAFHPEGPWVLTAILPDKPADNGKRTTTQTFTPQTADEMRNWVARYNTDHNVYYHVAIPTRHLTSKAERGDIATVTWLHVDIDPKGKEDLDQFRLRTVQTLRAGRDGIPPASCCVSSGGGIQAFWLLSEPIQIGGDLTKAESAKAHNQRLEVIFNADNCHNIDRIMRLPGTVNWPDARKRRKGREPRLAECLWIETRHSHSLSLFPALQTTQAMTGSGVDGQQLQISENCERIDLDDLDQYEVSDRVKVIIVQGMHPDEIKDGDNSRSAWVFDCVTRLVKCGVPDQMIYSILTDPDFGISESILENPNSERYAKRQIARARQYAIDPQLLEMNERHAVIRNFGGKCVIIEEVMDHAVGRTRVTKTSFTDIRNAYMHLQVEIGENDKGEKQYSPLGAWWLKHPQRRQYDTLCFAPCKEIPGAYNLWRGFGVQAIPGDVEPFLEHLRVNLCDNNEVYFEYLVNWMARAVQFPDRPGETAIVLRGDQGTGKSFFAKEFGALFGRHFLTVSDPKHLVGSFNAHLRDCVVLFGDEAFFAGDKKHESTLKTMITDDMITIEAKGVDVEPTRNYTHLILASNSEWVIPAGSAERRYFVLDVKPYKRQDSMYFRNLVDFMLAGGREALLHYLMTRDLKGFQVRHVPQTEALQHQKLWSLPPMEEWWFTILSSGEMHPSLSGWPSEIMCELLTGSYTKYTASFNITRRGNATQLGRFLSKVVPLLKRVQRQVLVDEKIEGTVVSVQKRPYFWQFPSLAVCREAWEETYGRANWS